MQITHVELFPDSRTFLHTASPTAERLLFYPICSGHCYYINEYHTSLYHTDSIIIIHIIKGSLIVETNKIKKTAFAKETLILDWTQPTQFSCPQPSECIWVCFKGANSLELYKEIMERYSCLLPKNRSITIYQILLALHQILSHPERVTDQLLTIQIYRLLCEFLNPILPISSEHLNYEKLIQETKRYVVEHLAETLSVKKLAARIHLSPSYFSKIFKQQTGFSPYAYILTERLIWAKELLKNSNYSILEIAEQIGFNSESNFIYFFTSNTGISPYKYRKY